GRFFRLFLRRGWLGDPQGPQHGAAEKERSADFATLAAHWGLRKEGKMQIGARRRLTYNRGRVSSRYEDLARLTMWRTGSVSDWRFFSGRSPSRLAFGFVAFIDAGQSARSPGPAHRKRTHAPDATVRAGRNAPIPQCPGQTRAAPATVSPP